MTTYTYTDTPNSNLVCCICHAPFTDPTTTKTCSHTFCHHCILEAVKHSPQCPVDRSPLSLQSLLPANPIVKHTNSSSNVPTNPSAAHTPAKDSSSPHTSKTPANTSPSPAQNPTVPSSSSAKTWESTPKPASTVL
ncbi:hypothetical protein SERLADRAFT_437174 [Serpula lacrymans var. lacrymans S7.9]|uniref:RING-type domain-containing protein n=1 Tax=Serpula lacrymans var. lacrymans (strain S7.9) TaxID=578457 RepID=F8NSV2_SERL9|nr:uncharacterized protein SERLADRAFT_437174 [Serpula lacrymans var. lacrymans S7.9]EGO25425.1 hypothetical protein SERLADRAFT_437174 [Serpula lacrymans var. lacrymans S7.9]